ncbi:MAG: LytR C-terminal domain-containing protein, partial [bacterium]|nr:LytR C-terminal domain-containing protein [bacterium]
MSIAEREHARGKAERRRRLQVRQTLVFGSLILLLGVILFIAWLQWTRAIPSPFAREFTTEDVPRVSDTVACPADGQVMVPAAEITAVVLNSTPTSGLATGVADELTLAGVHIVSVGNWSETVLQGQGVIQVGPAAITEAYSLQALLPGMAVMLVESEEESATVILGTQFQNVAPASALQPGTPIAVPPGCAAGAVPGGTPTGVPTGEVPP